MIIVKQNSKQTLSSGNALLINSFTMAKSPFSAASVMDILYQTSLLKTKNNPFHSTRLNYSHLIRAALSQ